MSFDWPLLWPFLVVFVRCSAMLFTSPVFGAQNTPLQIRTMTTLAISGALCVVIKPSVGPPPSEVFPLVAVLANEIIAGMVLGLFVQIAFTAFQMAGSLLDLQVGLGMSQQINPATGVPTTLLSHYKHMLAIVVFFAIGAHQLLIRAFAESYSTMPMFGVESFGALSGGLTSLITNSSLLALQIAAPVAAVGFVVDAAMGIVNRAVPQMPVFLVGIPAKIGMGIAAMSFAVPLMAASVSSCVDMATDALGNVFR